jgi:hypothetical protein
MRQLLAGLLLVLAAVFVAAVSPLGGQTMRQLGVPSTPAIAGGDGNDVIYTTDGLTLSGSDAFEFNGAQVTLGNNVGLAFHASGQAAFLYNTDQTHDDLQLGINVNGTSGGAGYFSLMQKADLQHANRAASAPSPDPVFRIYSSDQAQAGDFFEFTHNQTNAVLNVGTGSAGGFSIITGGTAALSIDSSQVVTASNILMITPKASAPGTCSIGQFYVDTSGAACACSAADTWSNMHSTGSCA